MPAAVGLSVILLLLGRLAVKAQRLKSVTGAEGLVGEEGRALTPLGPERTGRSACTAKSGAPTSRHALSTQARAFASSRWTD